MKGQAVFEFVVAAMLFFVIIFYMLSFLSTTVSSYRSGFGINRLEAKAIDVSDALVRINLTEKYPVLSYGRIGYLDGYCAHGDNYVRLLSRFGIYWTGGGMRISVKEGRKTILDCGDFPPDAYTATVDRYMLSENNTLLGVGVVVW